jgi:hypothetical protein
MYINLTIPLPLGLSMCLFTLVDVLIMALYIVLLSRCLRLHYRHRDTYLHTGEVNGLLWYLACTAMLCFFRTVAFVIIPLTNRGEACDMKYSYLEWDVGGAYQARNYDASSTTSTDTEADSSQPTTSFQMELIQLILSSSASGLFFTSYSYFASSLARVLDMLTTDVHAASSPIVSSGHTFFLVLLLQNVFVWVSIITLWAALMFRISWASGVDDVSRFVVCVSAITSGAMFSTHVYRASAYLERMGHNNPRASQLQRLLKLRRVNGVCRVCTVCFTVKGLLLAAGPTLNPVLVALYFIFVEISPTAYMLHVFSR